MSSVSYVNATCIYRGAASPAVDMLNLDIRDGEFMVLVGPSGSGKSTALRMLAGLEPLTRGQILIDGEDVSRRPPRDRDVAMVFQNYALYPHMTVGENIGFPLKLNGAPKIERDRKVAEAAKILALDDLLDRKPKALSGGQRQRVAMGRAIVREPQVFLMDEPLSNLDAKLRVETRASIAALQARLGTTMVYVTHDQTEAMTMGHRVALLDGGRLQQCDTPRNIYERPANVFAAEFVGSPAMNLRRVHIQSEGVRLGNVMLPVQEALLAAARNAGLSDIILGLRPDAFSLAMADDGLKMEVKIVEELGADAYLYGSLMGDDPDDRLVIARVDGKRPPRVGDVVFLRVRPGDEHGFHPHVGSRLA